MTSFFSFIESQMAANVLLAVELLVIVAGFIFTIKSIKQASDSRNIDFVINAEGQIDPLFLALAEQDTDTIRQVLRNLIPADVPDDEVKAFVLTYYAYRHASRIYYMFSNDDISLGMDATDRKRMADEWMNEMKKYDLATIRKIHAFSKQSDEFNAGFMTFVDEFLASADD
ncbi:hypothetical protein KX928_14475 [Roseobacter sp. YSTF-M11]|uniref:Uncharacterized protein n=1 Tax=Roseobacter insulae TaxID=2859783 RepID=A0A9X1FXC5_9RHOB|nr:hypothetical protein [Roseobacter insulae]MBW4708992.1 hypothetical protein [Roseobacter insulae]